MTTDFLFNLANSIVGGVFANRLTAANRNNGTTQTNMPIALFGKVEQTVYNAPVHHHHYHAPQRPATHDKNEDDSIRSEDGKTPIRPSNDNQTADVPTEQ